MAGRRQCAGSRAHAWWLRVLARCLGPRRRHTAGLLQVVTATPRQLESLVRLSEAQARMRLRDTVIEADVEEALRLMKARQLGIAAWQRRPCQGRPCVQAQA